MSTDQPFNRPIQHERIFDSVSYSGTLERRTLGRELDGLRLPNPDPAHRRHIDALASDADPLGDTERQPGALLGLEPGELGPALEEIDIGTLEICQRLLQHLRIEVVEPGLGSLPFGEFCRQLAPRLALAVLPIVLLAAAERPVVYDRATEAMRSSSMASTAAGSMRNL